MPVECTYTVDRKPKNDPWSVGKVSTKGGMLADPFENPRLAALAAMCPILHPGGDMWQMLRILIGRECIVMIYFARYDD
jgi:hypothetical protein